MSEFIKYDDFLTKSIADLDEPDISSLGRKIPNTASQVLLDPERMWVSQDTFVDPSLIGEPSYVPIPSVTKDGYVLLDSDEKVLPLSASREQIIMKIDFKFWLESQGFVDNGIVILNKKMTTIFNPKLASMESSYRGESIEEFIEICKHDQK